MPRKIKTVGDLRSVLADAIESVVDGSMDPGKAKTIVALAAQVNNSLLAEVEAARLTLAADKTYAALGALPVGTPLENSSEPKQIESGQE